MSIDIIKTTAGRFVLLFMILYAVIQALGYVPVIKDAYRDHYIKMTDTIFSDFRKDGIVKANRNDDKDEKELDVLIMLSSKPLYQEAIKNGTNVRIAKTFIFTKFLGFLPLSVLLALVLATPLQWKQKIIALVAGLILVECYIFFRLWLHLMYSFNNFEWLDIVHLSPGMAHLIDFLGAIFISNVVVTVLVPLFIWIVVAVIPFPNSAIAKSLNAMMSKAIAAD